MITVVIAEDQFLFRKGVVVTLSAADDIAVVGEAENGLEAVDAVERLQPNLVLMDLDMPVVDGVEATRRIKAAHPETRVVVLTCSEVYKDLFAAIKAGADGYLLKNLGPENLASAVRQAYRGETPLSSAIAGNILKEFRQAPRTREPGALTARELQVLQLATESLSYKEISTMLYISESTVKNHMRHIMEKLHLRNRSALVRYAFRHGLVPAPVADVSHT